MANGIEMRIINRNLVYRTMLRSGVMSKQELSRITELSIPTVAQNLKQLSDEGLVETTGIMESTGGRRAVGYQCVRGARCAIGIDITQNHIRFVLVNVAGDMVYETNRELFQFSDEDACYDQIADCVKQILKDNAVDEDSVLGIGLSLPCIVDRTENKVTYSRIIEAPADIAARLRARLPFNVEVFNDANSAGYAEFYGTEWQDNPEKMCFYLMLSNSVGGAVINQSGIYLGNNSRSAEVGHIRIVPDGKPCYCGQRGCVNAYCSAKNLSDMTGGSLEEYFAHLSRGMQPEREVFNEYLYYLALTAINIRMLYDSEIIIGGYVGAYMEPYMDELRVITARLDPYSNSAGYLRSCSFKHDASAIGAALNFIGKFIENS